MRAVFALLFAGFLAVPAGASAAFFLETTYASSPVNIDVDVDAGGTVGEGVRGPSQNVQQHLSTGFVSSAMSLSEVSAVSSAAPAIQQAKPKTSASSSSSSAKSLSEEESDLEILMGLPAFADEVTPDYVEEEKKIYQGLSFSGATEMDETLPPTEREAILRADIQTVEQLKLFIRALAESDENIRKIEVVQDRIIISYRSVAKILGLFPVSYLLETTVDDDGVSVPQPWWHFFATDGVDDYVLMLEEAIVTDVDESDENGMADILKRRQQLLQTISKLNQAAHDMSKSIIQKIKA